MKKPEFKFHMTSSAAQHNWTVLKKYDLDLQTALNAQKHTQLYYGSEFRPPEILEPLLKHHPLWPRLSDQLNNGAFFPLNELSEEERIQDLNEALEFGNHKGADDNPELFEKMMKADVDAGYSLIIPRDKVTLLKGALMSPMNIADQSGIDEHGNIINKKRLTHNQSMEYSSGTSINNRVKTEDLQDVMYGSCLLRVIHQIVEYRSRFPQNRILIQKIDFKSAYRRTHLNAISAIQTITQLVSMAVCYISLRLTFGGAPNPNFWGEVSETITDIANAILQSDDWDPDKLHSPLQSKIPPMKIDNDIRPFTKALPTIVDVNITDKGQADCYIDDITTTIVDIGDNYKRAAAAVLLAIATMGRPTDTSDPIPRIDLVSLSKLKAEAELEEIKILLGWKLDTRALEISLPFEKYRAWTNGIDSILKRSSTTFDELETLIGRLGHVSVVIPQMKHFMSRIRQLMFRSKNRRKINIPTEVTDDLIFHKKMLQMANDGINMNLITYRDVDRAYRSDACPAGLGGYSDQGRAWRFFIPLELQFRATLNMLEHLGSIIGPWIDIIEKMIKPYSCTLSLTDSTTSAGWLRKSNFKESDNESNELTKAKLKMSRDHALRLLSQKIKDYSQWFPGKDNDLADSLSRDFHLSNDQLSQLYHSLLPTQTPANFRICPLPQEINSYIFSMLRTLPEQTQQPEKHKTSSLVLGRDGITFLNQWNSRKTHSSKTSQKDNRHSFSQPLHTKSEQESIAKEIRQPWLAKQSEVPWTTFLRPSEITTEPTRERTEMESLAGFYNNSTKAIRTRIHQKNNKKRSHSAL